MRKAISYFWLFGLAFTISGCSSEGTGVSMNETSKQNASIIDKSTEIVNNTEVGNTGVNNNVSIDSYSLTGEKMHYVDEIFLDNMLGQKNIAYNQYSDGIYDYYFTEDMSCLRMIVCKQTGEESKDELRKADNSDCIKDAASYIEIISPWISFSESDWEVDRSSSDISIVNLSQTVGEEKVIVASFYYENDELSGLNLETDIMKYVDNNLKLIDKSKAVESAGIILNEEYGDIYRKYSSSDNNKVFSTATLNAHGGNLYWYIQVYNGSYGGFVAEIDAVTGDMSYVDQIK